MSVRLPPRARNAAIVAAYTAQSDISQRELGRAFGVSKSVVGRVIDDAGARDPGRQSAVKRRQHREGLYAEVNTGRKPAWPDCPLELRRDFMRLRNKGVPATEARRILDPGTQA